MSPANSMQQHIDYISIASRAIQLRNELERRSRNKLSCILVEGESDQSNFLHLINQEHSFLVPASGKQNALGALEHLKTKYKYSGLLVILDDDYDTLQGKHIEHPNVVMCDAHDLETMILQSQAFEKFLGFLLPADRQRFVNEIANDLRDTLIQMASPLGYLRWASQKLELKLVFKTINFRAFLVIDAHSFSTNETYLITEVLARNGACRRTIDEIKREIDQLRVKASPWFLVCRGHDLMKILSLILRKKLVTYEPRNGSPERQQFDTNFDAKAGEEWKLVDSLMMCYEKNHFQTTKLYQGINNWESANPPYKVLA